MPQIGGAGALLLALTLWMAVVPALASAQPAPDATVNPLHVVGVLDARYARRGVALMVPPNYRGRQLRYVNISSLDKARSECCVVIANKPAAPQASNAATPSTGSATGTLTRRAKDGFFAVLVATAPTSVKRVSDNEVQLTWKAKAAVRVIHCLSSEGLNVRVMDAANQQETQRYYVSLGMDVAPDCTDALMPQK